MTELTDIKTLTDIEHAIARSGMYIGSVMPELYTTWVLDSTKMVQKEIRDYIPGLHKIVSEIIDNCLDNFIKGTCTEISITVETDTGTYTILDNGPGISSEKHSSGKYLPELLFSTLKSGSNFNDEKRLGIGLNGCGGALACIFSSAFVVETAKNDKIYIQRFQNNNREIHEPQIIKKKIKQPSTKITLIPDQNIFKKKLDSRLIRKRCIELSYMYPGFTINLDIDGNCEIFKGGNFEDFVKFFGSEYQIINEKKSPIRLALVKNSSDEFTNYSLVNGAFTSRGGSHIDFIKTCFVDKFKEMLWKNYKLEASSIDIAKHLHVIAFLNINAPQFDGQTKERLTTDIKEMETIIGEYLTPRKITSMCADLPKTLEQIYESLMSKNEATQLRELKKAQKDIKFKKVPKLIDCSSKDRIKCTLYLTEGDSAVHGFSAIRDTKLQAGLPLKGKVLNINGEKPADIIKNAEIQSLMSVIGLEIGKSPIRISRGKVELETLRYGNISILTDADHDGSSIRCLLINFFFRFWPELFEHKIITISEAPLFRIRDKKTEESVFFYERPEFNEFLKTHNTSNCEISYFKGLGSCDKEGWNFFINKQKKMYPVEMNEKSKDLLEMAFGDNADIRKAWLR